MNILFAVSEIAPYSKTGGLADVAGALPKALAALGVNISVFTPRYGFVQAGELAFDDLAVPFGGGVKTARVFRERQNGVTVYFLDAPEYFARDNRVYGEWDDAERFAFYSRAALECARRLGTPPDVVHCNDWMSALIPVYLRTALAQDPFFKDTATILSIHNLAFQGFFDGGKLAHFGLPSDLYFGHDGLEFSGAASALKGGVLAADALTTVSERYALEIQTPEYGFKMDALLRARRYDLTGILNGVDYDEWNPEKDPHIAARYSPFDLAGKRECKRDLLATYGLSAETDRPLLGVVSRINDQKGFDLLCAVSERILRAGASFVLLGAGDSRYEVFFQHLRNQAPDRVGVYFGLNESLAHKIEAGADIFLMPSAYEPCGLNQIYSLKYGTVPIVRATGGLDDTIQDFDRLTRTGNGFKFHAYRADKFLEKIYEALILYPDRDIWETLMRNGMQADYSWTRSAHRYLDCYRRVRSLVEAA